MFDSEFENFIKIIKGKGITTIEYKVYQKRRGLTGWYKNGEVVGTTDEGRRLESIVINCPNINLKYRVHVWFKGWLNWVSSGQESGPTGNRLEAIVIIADAPLIYKVYLEDKGWSQWYINGQVAGTIGEWRRIEAIRIKLL